jgi:holo-[acyl-carrier protein] synthase
MQTLNMKGGRPAVVLSGPLAQWYEMRFGQAHVSLTDESEYGAAYVVVESLPDLSHSNYSNGGA